MSEIRDISITFEAVKTSLSQTKDGMILRLAIHPNDMPRQLMTDWVGSRYQIAMVKLGDDDQPEVDEETLRLNRMVKTAGMLCRNPAFHKFLMSGGRGSPPPVPADAEKWAADSLRKILGVQSRSEIKGSPEAAQRLSEVIDRFEWWRQQNPGDAGTGKRPEEGQ